MEAVGWTCVCGQEPSLLRHHQLSCMCREYHLEFVIHSQSVLLQEGHPCVQDHGDLLP